MSRRSCRLRGAWMALVLLQAACAPRSGELDLPDEASQGIPYTLAQRFQVDPVNLDVDVERAVWPDACLGVRSDHVCAQVVTPGYRAEVEVDGEDYEFRSSETDPLNLILAAGPDPDVEQPVLVARDEGEQCRTMLVASDGRAAIGTCGGPLVVLPLLEGRRRPEELTALTTRFAPFEYTADSLRLSLHGNGTETASPVWKRAIATWARIVYPEVESGRAGASWGSAFAWQHPTERSGYCNFLVVVEYGQAFASTARCEGGDAEDVGYGWLTDEEMATFDAWYYRYAPVYREQEGLRFFGRGAEKMPGEDVGALARWAGSVFERLARG